MPTDQQQLAELFEMTPDQLEEARRYGRTSLRCSLADMGIDFVYLLVAAIWIGPYLDQKLAGITFLAGAHSLPRVAAIGLLTVILHAVVSFGLSFYAGYVVEHRYGLSTLSAGKWFQRWLGKMGLALAFSTALYTGLYAIIWNAGNFWWLVAAGVFFLLSIVAGQLMPVIIMPLFYKTEKLENPELMKRMEVLSAGTGLTIEGVYRLGLSAETTKVNAMLAGVGNTRRVLMGDTLLEKFTPDEIDVIFAHEIGHHVHKHIPKMIGAGLLWSLAGFWLCNFALQKWTGISDPSAWPAGTLPTVMLVMWLFGFVSGPLLNFISRHYERQCDRYALARTKNPVAYRHAFAKLARLNKADPDPHWLEVALMDSHPALMERLALADEVS